MADVRKLQLLIDIGTVQGQKEMEVLKRKYQKNMALMSRQSRVRASIVVPYTHVRMQNKSQQFLLEPN